MKYTVRPSGIYTLNNTFVSNVGIVSFSNGHFRNNLFIAPDDSRPVFSATTLSHYSSMDYNGYRINNKNKTNIRLKYPMADSLNNRDESELKWMEYKSIQELTSATGLESHGLELDESIFNRVSLPDSKNKGRVYQLAGYDFRLRPGSRAIDTGCVLSNINNDYVGKAPDLGALEYGGKVYHYGPRK
jgi:hypothetical protein